MARGWLFGIDAEFIIRNEDNAFVSAHLLAEKGLYEMPEGITNALVGRDGVFLEVATTPTYCRILLLRALYDGLKAGMRMLQRRNDRFVETTKLRPQHATEVRIPAAHFKVLPETANVAGCAGSLNVYGDGRGPEEGTLLGPKRYGGLHFHYSGDSIRTETTIPWKVRLLDRMVGLVSVLMDPFPKQAALRRKMYGEAGCYRQRRVRGGDVLVLEYRVPSGCLALSPTAIHVLAGLTEDALKTPRLGPRACQLGIGNTTIQGIINESDQKEARKAFAHVFKTEPFKRWLAREFPYRRFTVENLIRIFASMGRRIAPVNDRNAVPTASHFVQRWKEKEE